MITFEQCIQQASKEIRLKADLREHERLKAKLEEAGVLQKD